MTFPNRNAGGSGVYARSLVGYLRARSDLHMVEIACKQQGTVHTLRWLSAGAYQALKHARVDLLHCPAYVAPFRSPVPTIITLHDAAARHYPGDYPLEWRIFSRFILPLLVPRAATFITATEFSKKDLLRFYRILARRIVVINDAADARYMPQPQDKVTEYRKRLGDTGPLLLFVGSPIARKNLDVVLAAMAGAADDALLSTSRLLISGATAERFPRYRVVIEASGLAGRVQWLGRVPDDEMPLLYAATDLLVYPSFYEGFGLPPIEAMAVGTPVVASNASCLPEVLGGAALLVKPSSTEGFAAAMESVLSKPELRATLVRLGFAQAAKYNWHRCAQETERLYRRVSTTLRRKN